MTSEISRERLERCYGRARSALLAERTEAGHWVGELSTSALSTATAVMALEMVRQQQSEGTVLVDDDELRSLISGGLNWLAGHQNADGGWGDTTKSLSNISTTMLAHAVFHATGAVETYRQVIEQAQAYIERIGGVEAVRARYGKDKTFSVPILTHCALAGLVEWEEVSPLPFELACLPANFYKTVRLPVVSYALPALIAIGQARYHHRKPRNPLIRWLRGLARGRSLRVLESIQPTNGGFLEAAPLTSFVTMSLASMGLIDHPVVRRGVTFLRASVRDDGSWPIDTNLATWVTTLSVNALQDDLPEEAREPIRTWLLDQQYRERHPYTNADPGGWAWTDLPGGVPDADDTPGAILAVLNLLKHQPSNQETQRECDALAAGVGWLLGLQNRDGGWPTFCRGWGTLPFDRSAADISAHVLRALSAWLEHPESADVRSRLVPRVKQAIRRGFDYLDRVQRADGFWLPLWFGNQFAPEDENPTYGTARVLAAYRDTQRLDCPAARKGLRWLIEARNADGGWGGCAGLESTVEETALAAEVLISTQPDDSDSTRAAEAHSRAAVQGVSWLMDRVEEGRSHESSPIGFYFAKLWYFEKLYPLSFTVAALASARRRRRLMPQSAASRSDASSAATR